jgi:hypothetical protein
MPIWAGKLNRLTSALRLAEAGVKMKVAVL